MNTHQVEGFATDGPTNSDIGSFFGAGNKTKFENMYASDAQSQKLHDIAQIYFSGSVVNPQQNPTKVPHSMNDIKSWLTTGGDSGPNDYLLKTSKFGRFMLNWLSLKPADYLHE